LNLHRQLGPSLRACFAAVLVSFTVLNGAAARAGETVVYYNQGNGVPAEQLFSFKVLKLALAKSGKTYVLKPSPLGKITERRATEAMIAGEKLDVAMLGANAAVDAKLRPVRIPIDKGLLGYRIFLIDGARQAEFSRVRTLADLRRFSALHGLSWPDTQILRHAGLPVWTGAYASLPRMTMARRADYFPRAAHEVFGDQAKASPDAPGLAVEKTLVLRYRFTALFYVSKANKQLHDDLYRGFLAAYDDGSYEALFRSDPDIRAALTRANLKSRRVIEIDNPYLSPETAAIDERFWFKP